MNGRLLGNVLFVLTGVLLLAALLDITGKLSGLLIAAQLGGNLTLLAANCSDGWQNELEEGVDCGVLACGVECPTCTDGMQNQNETDIDCGGPYCDACQTCSDGILNQNETGIDCGGGSCDACPVEGGNQHDEERGITQAGREHSGQGGSSVQSVTYTFPDAPAGYVHDQSVPLEEGIGITQFSFSAGHPLRNANLQMESIYFRDEGSPVMEIIITANNVMFSEENPLLLTLRMAHVYGFGPDVDVQIEGAGTMNTEVTIQGQEEEETYRDRSLRVVGTGTMRITVRQKKAVQLEIPAQIEEEKEESSPFETKVPVQETTKRNVIIALLGCILFLGLLVHLHVAYQKK